MNGIDYQQLASALMAHQATTYKTPSGNPTANVAHGPGGVLSPLGLSRGIGNAMIMPSQGMMARLPRRPNRDENPLYGIFTGVTATTGNEPNTQCDDPPKAGKSKLCMTTYTFGFIGRSSDELNIMDAGQRINRGEFFDMRLVGNPLQSPKQPNLQQNLTADFMRNFINNEYGKLAFELQVALLRDQARELYTGNPANNVGTGRQYYRGFDLLINTGYQDVISGQACPAADSTVRSFGNLSVETNGGSIVEEITYIIRELHYIASRAGYGNTLELELAMSWGLFYALTEVWPCAYNTYRCQNLPTGSVNNLDSSRMNEMRDRMRGNQEALTGQYLLVDGRQIPVCIDDAITEVDGNTAGSTLPAGTFASDIYFIPRYVLGNRSAPVSEGGGICSYMEYFPMSGSSNLPYEVGQMMSPTGSYRVSPDGQYLYHMYAPKNLCVQMVGWHKPRLRVETPYLAARLTDIAYTPLIKERSAFTDSAYFVNGGRTNYVGFGPSYEAPTA